MDHLTEEHDATDPVRTEAEAWAALFDEDPDAVRARVLERTRAWVEHETPSGDAVRATALAGEIGAALADAGASVESVVADGWGRHLVADVPGREPERAPVLVLGHLDTVHPVGTLEERPFTVRSGRAEGPGVFDMKASLAVLVEALDLLDGSNGPRRPVRVIVTCDEEVNSPTSRERIEDEGRNAGAVLVLEPPLPGGRAKTARKGVATYDVHVTGRAAHAGLDPEAGVNAATELARRILEIEGLADPEQGTTLNVGVIGGGTATNVVPEEARAAVEVRYARRAEGERVHDALRALATDDDGASIHVSRRDDRPPLERTDDVVTLYRHARRLADELGFDLGEGAAGGASDGCFTAAVGAPTLDGLGVQGGGAHAAHEHIIVADLPRRVALLHRLIETL